MKKRLTSLLLVLLLLAFMLCTVNADTVADEAKGSLLIVGGALGSTNKAVYDKFIDLAGGKDEAKFGIIPAASSSLSSSYGFKDDLISYGVPEENVVIIPIAVRDDSKTKDVDESTWIENAKKQEVADQIENLTGIWFVGGDQTRITKALLNSDGTNTVALDAIWDVYIKGGVIGGSSAGAAIMSNPMLAGGTSLGAINEGFTDTYEDENDQLSGPVYAEAGLGFFQYGIVDQHFNTRARLGRLIVAAYTFRDKYSIAYGVDEDTAMIYNAQTKTVEVVGAGGLTIVDISKAEKDDRFEQVKMKDIILNFIEPGDQYNVETKEFNISDSKDLTNGYEYYYVEGPITNTGVLSGYNQVKEFIMYNLVDNEAATEIKSYCYDDNGVGAELVFKKTADTLGYWGYRDGNKDGYSAVNVMMDINPIKVNIEVRQMEYLVKGGDMLWKIAQSFNTTIDSIVKANNLKNPNLIYPGQVLVIPQ